MRKFTFNVGSNDEFTCHKQVEYFTCYLYVLATFKTFVYISVACKIAYVPVYKIIVDNERPHFRFDKWQVGNEHSIKKNRSYL